MESVQLGKPVLEGDELVQGDTGVVFTSGSDNFVDMLFVLVKRSATEAFQISLQEVLC